MGAQALATPGTSYDLATWEGFLLRVDPSLPTTSALNSKICYYFDVSQTCSGEAIGTLLGKAAITNPLTWTPTNDDCAKLLDGQRDYVQSVANDIFEAAITSAAITSVGSFEHMVQSWVLRVGYFNLMENYADLVAAVNAISDWKTVQCNGSNIEHDGVTTPKPGFFADLDCSILGSQYVAPIDCSNSGCILLDANKCCEQSLTNSCCLAKISVFTSECSMSIWCGYKNTCCAIAPSSPCCLGRF